MTACPLPFPAMGAISDRGNGMTCEQCTRLPVFAQSIA